MTDLLSTRTQRNWGTDHVYLENANIANIWECITGKKTVSETDLSNLESLIRIIVELPRENKWHCVYCNSGYSQFEEYVQHKMRHGYTRDQVGESSDD